MTLAELQALPDAEIDRLVAERVMGWQYSGFCRQGPVFWQIRLHDSSIHREIGIDYKPSTDHNDAASVRAEIERRGLQQSYSVTLAMNVFLNNFRGWQDWRDSWALVNATPRQVCEAALLSVERL